MKLKLKQKIAIQLYKTKFKAISIVSSKKAALSIFNFFCTPHYQKLQLTQPLIFKQATPIKIIYNKLNINGFKFTPQHSNNKKILVLHGFDSCAYKSEAMIEKLLANNFEVIAFDAIAHGTSDGKTINAKIYSECIDIINKTYGEMYALVGHSLGGLAACLAVENYIPNLPKLILIAPATETTTAITKFFNFLQMPLTLQPKVENVIFELSGKPASYFSVSRVVETIDNATLWVHDKADFICPIEDVLPVQNKKLPHIQFYITNRLGHNLVYRSKDVLTQVVVFLNNDGIVKL